MKRIVVRFSAWICSSKIDDRGLHRDVKRRNGLVGHQDLGLGREGAGDRDPLLLAA